MRRWFDALPIHRKLITLVLAVSSAALMAAVVGLVAFDVERFRGSAIDETREVAQVIAENAAAAIVFDDADAARQTLASVSVRPVIVRACIYRVDGSLFAAYTRAVLSTCPSEPAVHNGWRSVGSKVDVDNNGRAVGAVYVERSLSDLTARITATVAVGGVMLLVAGGIALLLAQRLQGMVSRPIVALAQVARAIGGETPYSIPSIPAPPDETGDLVRAFEDMVRRVGETNRALLSSNDELRTEVDRRKRMQDERERLLAREREASRLKDEFLAAVSHELRTPLNAILGWTQILTNTTPSEQTLAKAIASMSRNAHAQHRMIEDLLDVSRIITGKLQLTLSIVDLRLVMESAVEVVGPMATAKTIHLEADLPDFACAVRGDPDRLRQVAWNLLSNAVKFTPAGGAVRVRLKEEEGSYVIAVSDNGIGIPEEFLSHVFERFRQADGSTTRQHGGLGLGLAIVKELAELHGGSVCASSGGAGLGSTFTVTLPSLGGGPLRQAINADLDESMLTPRLDGLSVLAVDDNRDALDIVTVALSQAGATVGTAVSGSEAVAEWQRTPFQLLLCDLAMPQMDGFDVLNRIRQIDAAAGRVTCALAVTAYASEADQVRCLRAGFQGYLAKPYNPVDLVRAVAAAARDLERV